MAEASLKLGGSWATKEDSLLGYNDENGNYKPIPFDFSRASIGTRVNRDGLIEVVQDNIPRIDFSGDGSLLLEPQRTNLILNSEAISNTPIKNGTFTDNFAISPDGTQNATKLTATSTDPFFYQSITFAAADYTASVYVKGIGNSVGKNFEFRIGSNISPTFTIPSEWTRFDYTATMTSGTVTSGIEIPNPAISGDEVLIWGWQLEAGSYSTSLIPTSGSAVTRVADVCDNGETTFNDSEGVLYAEIAALADDLENRYIGICNGTDNERVLIGFRNSSNSVRSIITGGSASDGIVTFNISDITIFNKIAVRYNASEMNLWINGTEVGTDSSFILPTGLSQINFDSGQGSSPFYGNCKELRVYNTALSDTELQELTTI